jgi:cyanophycinase-like exopeptidase
MSENGAGDIPGALALVGSGEYTAAMRQTDSFLLDTLGGAPQAHVALLPTASGREAGGPERWNAMGAEHFRALGVQDIRSVLLIDREAALNPAILLLLAGANFHYFSGGDPSHVIQSLRDTPSWELVLTAHRCGAVLAGCSAGAMALSGLTLSIHQVRTGAEITWLPALGVVPHVITFPHFDRMAQFIGEARFHAITASMPEGYTGLGIDEDTAIVRLAPPVEAAPARWLVMGRQSVSILAPGASPCVLRAGDEISL